MREGPNTETPPAPSSAQHRSFTITDSAYHSPPTRTARNSSSTPHSQSYPTRFPRQIQQHSNRPATQTNRNSQQPLVKQIAELLAASPAS
ncbi:hypothetical protein K439DRAFT_1629973 [Ramaria rubella]|nr:hypothetical protein K439DRAFT_1629973 [Ramaria rubella]